MRNPFRTAAVAVLTAALLAIAAPAMAHVTVQFDNTAAGAFAKATFRVPHGCDGSATTAVRVQIPDGIGSVTPQVNDGWDIEIIGESEEVTEVVWRGGPLPDGHLDEFGLSLQLPEDAAGETLYFPVVQECEDGESAWIEIPDSPDADEPEHPAPALAVTAAEGDGHAEVAALEDAEPTSATTETAATSPLTVAALVAALLGLVVSGAALVIARRRT